MKVPWQRLLGSVAFTLVVIAVVCGRSIVAGQLGPPELLIGLLLGTIAAYRAWPAFNYVRWRR
jgi:hypothetical protein